MPFQSKQHNDADDSCEDIDLKPSSDLDEAEPVVDVGGNNSDLEGHTSVSDSDSSLSDNDAPKVASHKEAPTTCGPATGVPATGVPATYGKTGPSIFDNGFFFLKGNEFDLKMFIHQRWLIAPPKGLGRHPTMTKTLTPSTIGELRKDPVRTTILLKSWMVWRARGTPGWIDCCASRQRIFTEEAHRLLVDIKLIQPQADGLLGNAVATNMLREWVPDVVELCQS